MNRLYYGDCLTVMRDFMHSSSVDLIYLDPPYNSNRTYNSIYRDETGRQLPDQIDAFCDMWEMDAEKERALRHMPVLMLENGIDEDTVAFWKLWMNALRNTRPKLLAYLSYMVERLLQMRVILKSHGSIYLHCDPTASHYIKAMMDAVFGHENFRNEIVWKRFNFHADAKKFGAISDRILYYSKGPKSLFNPVKVPYSKEYIERKFTHQDSDGRRYRLSDLSPPSARGPVYEFYGVTKAWRLKESTMRKLDSEGRIYSKSKVPQLKRYLEEMPGQAIADIWTDIPPINSQARERLGYATQKPVKLIERIIKASSNEGDVVFDPFCGCASTLEAADRLKRRWIGIDVAIHAVKRVAKARLERQLGIVQGVDFSIDGVPKNMEGARDLWQRDKHQFQKWAVEQVDGFVTTKRTADGGIDGRLYFGIPEHQDLQSMVIEVKGGKNVGIGVLRQLRGVLEREDAVMAGLIVMNDLGATKRRNFEREILTAGDLMIHGIPYPKMQMLTVKEILGSGRFLTPTPAGLGPAQPRLPLG